MAEAPGFPVAFGEAMGAGVATLQGAKLPLQKEEERREFFAAVEKALRS